MDDFDLPTLPQLTSTRRPPGILTRKRTLDEYNDDVPPSAASSDPALFSGDEAVPGAEDYASRRKKKMYAGSWYSHRVKANHDDNKREFKRNYDSGIFMGSEGIEPSSSDSLGSLEEEFIQDQRKIKAAQPPTFGLSTIKSRPLLAASSLPFKPAISDVPPAYGIVIQIVQHCLDAGEESVDLSSMSLTSVPSQITSLLTMTKNTNLVSGMLEHGETLEPHLRLFLANNLFRRVPREILDLTNLRLLSLRRNKLTSLPPSIRNLVNLESLNIAGNKLPYLPFEVIELMRFHNLTKLTAEPNPWLFKPTPANVGNSTSWLRSSTAMLLYRWQVVLSEKSSTDTSLFNFQISPHSRSTPTSSTVPSLTETTLRSLARLAPHAELQAYMPPNTPSSVLTTLENLHTSHLDGGYLCSRCGRTIVHAGCEVMEWWTMMTAGEMFKKQERDFFSEQEEEDDDKSVDSEGVEVDEEFEYALPVKRMLCHAQCMGVRNTWCDDKEEEEKKAKRKGDHLRKIND